MPEQNGNHRINSRELAYDIAHAEYPHIEMARTAIRVNLQEEHIKHVTDAERAGVEAGRLYASSIANDLGNYSLVSETLVCNEDASEAETHREVHENYPGVHITKNEMIAYAEEKNVAGTSSKENNMGHTVNPNANKASSLWGCLCYLISDLKEQGSGSSGSGRGRRATPLIELDMNVEHHGGTGSNNRIDSLLSVSMDTLVNLVDEYDKAKALYPSRSTGQILGTGFGESRLAFLRGFIEYKKTQLAEETID